MTTPRKHRLAFSSRRRPLAAGVAFPRARRGARPQPQRPLPGDFEPRARHPGCQPGEHDGDPSTASASLELIGACGDTLQYSVSVTASAAADRQLPPRRAPAVDGPVGMAPHQGDGFASARVTVTDSTMLDTRCALSPSRLLHRPAHQPVPS